MFFYDNNIPKIQCLTYFFQGDILRFRHSLYQNDYELSKTGEYQTMWSKPVLPNGENKHFGYSTNLVKGTILRDEEHQKVI
jgi:hypothetical protein